MRTFTSCGRGIVLGLVVSGGAQAQSFNIDIAPPGAPPLPSSYAAAGQAGHWMSIPGTQSVTVFNLVDIDGQSTPARLFQIGGTETVTIDDPALSGNDALLMNDCLLTHTAIENCIFLSQMQPGMYEVIVYARRPAVPSLIALTNVDQEAGNPHLPVGGAWPGEHEQGVSYERHIATVAAAGANAGKLNLHSGVAPGGSFTIGAALNGFQVRHLVPIVGDLDGDFDVDFQDLVALLTAWGDCPDGACAADLDEDGTVAFGDLLILLAAWTA